jgi:hypothetical protein
MCRVVMRLGGLCLGLGLSLEVLEGEIAEETTNGDNTVDAESAASGGGAVVGRVGVGVGFGDRVAGLESKMLVGDFFLSHVSRIGVVLGGAYLALQFANEQLLKSLAGLVAVADILESLGGILAGDIEQNLLATTRKRKTQSQQLVVSQIFTFLFPPSCLRGPRKKRRGIAVDALAGKVGRTYGCSSMNLLQL